ncbi:MAG: hypothetical protein N3G18_01480 [Candidatus Saccharicenans sp.]|nr:hypothetical protein [Candidatus Saccharicenans sp.]
MAKSTVMWTVCPNGVKDGKLRFSAAVSIRLEEGSGGKTPSLSLFPEILNWPETVKAISFGVTYDKRKTAAPAEVKRISPDPELELWQAIFKPEAPVFNFKMADLSQNLVISYPVKNVMTFVASQYLNVAAESPEEPPPMEKVFHTDGLAQIRLKPISDLRLAQTVQLRTTRQVMAQSVRREAESQKIRAVQVTPLPQPPKDFFLLRDFHKPKNKISVDPKTRQPIVNKVPITKPEIDFHQALALITNYPALMRLLGLAIDFEMEVPPDFPASGWIKIVPQGRSDETPRTAYNYDPARGLFEAASSKRPAEVVNGFLNLADEEQYDLIQLDVDAVALKTAELADTAETKEKAELPALRSSGLGVIKNEQAKSIAEILVRAVELNNDLVRKKEIMLYAEDLVQGYRVDVWDEKSRQWHSLCQRIGTYRFIRLGRELTLEDEGFISPAVTQSADESSNDIFAHEALFHWDGWSLVAPRPGKTIDPEDTPRSIENKALTDFLLETSFKPKPGSLPRLRYGLGYRLRARAVDLAGNSLPLENPEDSQAIPPPSKQPFVFSRFDPVPSPLIILREEPKSGENVNHVVIKSFNESIEKDTVPTDQVSDRHVAPPKISQLDSEFHGLFDGATGLKPEVYSLICQRDGGQFKEIEPGEQIEIPYFPDPWARGACIRGLPYGAPDPMMIEFSGEWPDFRPFRIRLQEGSQPARWDNSSRLLTVYLKKGELVTLRISCYFPERFLPVQGLYRWLEKPERILPQKVLQPPRGLPEGQVQVLKTLQPPRIDLTRVRTISLQGRNWLMTPFRELTLMHATLQPVGKPLSKSLEARRSLGQTSAILYGEFEIHGPSTSKAELLADWKEPVDYLNEPGPRVLDGKAQVLEFKIDPVMTSLSLTPRPEAGRTTAQPGVAQPQTGAATVAMVKAPETPVYRHEFGDTKFRRVNYRLITTTRYMEQFPSNELPEETGYTRSSEPVEVKVLNSAPPAMPKIVYVVPSFKWERNKKGSQLTSVRKSALRVYLERPWYSTGEGELLAVILPPGITITPKKTAAATVSRPATPQASQRIQPQVQKKIMAPGIQVSAPAVAEKYKPYVTMWGTDPIWRSEPVAPPEYPFPEMFPSAVEVMGNLPLLELPEDNNFIAVGHQVEYDQERQLWFCDLELDSGQAYFPFIRLALARFQPESVPGAHLSQVVVANFAQILPERNLAVTFYPSNLREINVTLSGVSYIQGYAGSGPGEVEVALENKKLNLPDELGWEPVKEAVITLKPQRAGTTETGSFLWKGTLNLPSGLKLQDYRITVREYELFDTDEVDKTARTVAAVTHKKYRRLVYAETIKLVDL